MNREIKFVPYLMANGESSPELWFQLSGELGMVEFQIATNWYTPKITELRLQEMKKDVWRQQKDFLLRHFWMGPQPLDFCYFSPVQKSEDDCYWEDGAILHAPNIVPCYYGYKYSDEDGNDVKDVAYQLLLREGNDGLWNYLEKYYVEVFGELR